MGSGIGLIRDVLVSRRHTGYDVDIAPAKDDMANQRELAQINYSE